MKKKIKKDFEYYLAIILAAFFLLFFPVGGIIYSFIFFGNHNNKDTFFDLAALIFLVIFIPCILLLFGVFIFCVGEIKNKIWGRTEKMNLREKQADDNKKIYAIYYSILSTYFLIALIMGIFVLPSCIISPISDWAINNIAPGAAPGADIVLRVIVYIGLILFYSFIIWEVWGIIFIRLLEVRFIRKALFPDLWHKIKIHRLYKYHGRLYTNHCYCPLCYQYINLFSEENEKWTCSHCGNFFKGNILQICEICHSFQRGFKCPSCEGLIDIDTKYDKAEILRKRYEKETEFFQRKNQR